MTEHQTLVPVELTDDELLAVSGGRQTAVGGNINNGNTVGGNFVASFNGGASNSTNSGNVSFTNSANNSGNNSGNVSNAFNVSNSGNNSGNISND